MTYHGVECERVEPMAPEAYVCRWKDRNTLAMGLLSQGKGFKIQEKPGIKGVKNFMEFTFALITIDQYSLT